MGRLSVWAIGLLGLTLVVLAQSSSLKGVSVDLKSPWARHSLVSQTSEFLAQSSHQDYWSFIDRVSSDYQNRSSKEWLAWIQESLSSKPKHTLSLLSLSLALSSSSPKCQMYQQLGETLFDIYLRRDANLDTSSATITPWFALILTQQDSQHHGSQDPSHQHPSRLLQLATNMVQLDKALAKIKSILSSTSTLDSLVEDNLDTKSWPEIFSFDKILRLGAVSTSKSTITTTTSSSSTESDASSESTSKPVSVSIILHADLTSASFSEVHKRLREVSGDPSGAESIPGLSYILRPFNPSIAEWNLQHNNSSSLSTVREGAKPPGQGNLQGYAVELALKNVEYRVMDEKKSRGDDLSSSVAQKASEEILNQSNDPISRISHRLLSWFPNLESNVNSILEVINSGVLPTMEEGDIDQLGLKTFVFISRIINEAQNANLNNNNNSEDSTQDVVVVRPVEVLEAIQDISQNLPSVAPLIALLPVDDASVDQMEQLGQYVDSGTTMLTLNGQNLELDLVDPFTLLKTIRSEMSKYEQISNLGFSHDDTKRLMEAPLVGNVDTTIDLFFDDVISIVNDLEKHPSYAKWPKRVRDLLRPAWPGQLLPVAKNFFTVIMVVDPQRSKSPGEGVKLLDQLSRIILQNQIPIRLAFYVVTPNPAASSSSSSSQAASHSASTKEEDQVQFCSDMDTERCHVNFVWAKLLRNIYSDHTTFLTFLQLASQFPSSLNHLKMAWEASGVDMSWTEALASNSGWLKRQHHFLSSAGFSLNANTDNNIVLLNGKLLSIDPDEPLGALGQNLQTMKQKFQQDVHHNRVDDSTDLYRFALGDPSEVFPGYHPLIFASSTSSTPPKFINLANSHFSFSSLPFLIPEGSSHIDKKVTHLLVGDVAGIAFRQVLKSWIKAMEDSSEAVGPSQLAIVPSGPSSSEPLYRALEYGIMLGKNDLQKARAVIDPILEAFQYQASADVNLPLIKDIMCNIDDGKHCNDFESFLTQKKSANEWRSLQVLAIFLSLLNHDQTSIIIVTNGRVLALDEGLASSWDETSWTMLTQFELKARADVLWKNVHHGDAVNVNNIADNVGEGAQNVDPSESQHSSSTGLVRSEAMMKLVSLMNSFPVDPKVQFTMPPGHLVKTLSSASSLGKDPVISINLFINPLSAHAQKIPSILAMFLDMVPMEIKLVMMPTMGLSEIPLKNFYRYVASPSLRFHPVTGEILEEGAHFNHLPQDKIMTLNLQTSVQWLVAAKECEYDLDNLLLNTVSSDRARASFELEHLLVEGSCSDLSAGGQPPRGLKLVLGDGHSKPHMVDTLVMSNLGYFQLKSNPGVWSLALAEGRGSRLYEIDSIGNEHGNHHLLVSDFSSDKVNLKVMKKPGKEQEVLYTDTGSDDDEEGQSEENTLWGSIFGSNPSSSSSVSEDDKVHVFSVASGHLYERFMRIMMLSVKRSTKSPVKFWIIKNFLSPGFKAALPEMAKEFGFEVELVQYQWPRWLRGQTEKQRRIWGYKILFLDVLFPLSLKKVIFIDADQVVRSDLKDLMDLDLRGAPYGFTPFCQGEIQRKETSGFRFWDSGFWKDHLHGRPYHISALFVVDLQMLRRRGAADQLRATYDNLSRDPNSLANLDQDLPNYMQHHVPIFSLPREWLWCETWCTDESKQEAKTIDLCNNPLTKTPKLQNALRIIPEWQELDDTASAFMETLSNKSVGSSSSSSSSSSQAHDIPAEVSSASRTSTQNMDQKDEL